MLIIDVLARASRRWGWHCCSVAVPTCLSSVHYLFSDESEQKGEDLQSGCVTDEQVTHNA
jgi:hypothetical protein